MTIIRDGMRRMYAEQEDVYYYVTLMNENYPHPGMPEGSEAGILKGLYQLSDGGKTPKKGQRVQLMGSGTILREVMAAAELLKSDFGVAADVWSATSFNELRRDGMAAERWNRLHPTEPARKSHVEQCLEGHDGPVIAATDYMRNYADQVREYVQAAGRRYTVLGTDGFGRSDYRAQAAPLLRGRPLARGGGRAEGAGRRRRDQAGGGRRGDRQVRPRCRARGPLDCLRHDMSNAIDIKVPDIGDFKDVPVIEIFVKVGDTVKAEDPLVSLESDKATMDVPAPRGGKVEGHRREGRRQGQRRQRDHGLRGRGRRGRGRRARRGRQAQRQRAAVAGQRAGRRGRGARARHRRLQGRAGDRDLREGRRHGEGRGPARLARVRQGDDGRAGAAVGRRARRSASRSATRSARAR